MRLLALILALAACKKSSEPATKPADDQAAPTAAPAEPAKPADDMDEKMRHCPLAVPGSTTTLRDSDGGVQFEIVASGTVTDEIRRRSHHVVEIASGQAPKGTHGGGNGGGRMRNCPVVTTDVTIKIDEIDGGARLTVAPLAPDGLGELRRETAQRLDKFAFEGVTIVRR